MFVSLYVYLLEDYSVLSLLWVTALFRHEFEPRLIFLTLSACFRLKLFPNQLGKRRSLKHFSKLKTEKSTPWNTSGDISKSLSCFVVIESPALERLRTNLPSGVHRSAVQEDRHLFHHGVQSRVRWDRPPLQLRHLQRDDPGVLGTGISGQSRTSRFRGHDRGWPWGHLGHARMDLSKRTYLKPVNL